PGLQYLAHVDQLLVQQKVELLEVFTGFETKNKYVVTNSMGQRLFYVVEDTDCCTRWCFGPIRPFDIRVLDSQQHEVLHLSRPLRCQGCCCPCCLQELEVTAGGQVIGLVKEEWAFLRPKLTVMRPDGTPVLRIGGPICQCALCSDVSFPVLSADRSREVGNITKQWSGCVKEMFTDADNMGVSFPMDLETNMKATLLGALFLIEFMYFERQN
ncbi:phospholipid scramblase 1-like, partial [Pollicipes pollicipes]